MNKLDALNVAERDRAVADLYSCCASARWAEAVAARRPFDSFDALVDTAVEVWRQASESDKLEAFAAHPMIGDIELLRARFSKPGDRANAEQGQVLEAEESVLAELAQLNVDYRDRHGFIFIVYASDKSAADMLALLQARIDRSTADEINTAAAEQMKITELRLNNLLGDASNNAPNDKTSELT